VFLSNFRHGSNQGNTSTLIKPAVFLAGAWLPFETTAPVAQIDQIIATTGIYKCYPSLNQAKICFNFLVSNWLLVFKNLFTIFCVVSVWIEDFVVFAR